VPAEMSQASAPLPRIFGTKQNFKNKVIYQILIQETTTVSKCKYDNI
jgi:hypothetical protein